ncbi:MAG: hypothetical protein WCI18_10730 [Pseudomonadota bacterium]
MKFFVTAFTFVMISSCTSLKEDSETKDRKDTLEWILGDKGLETEIVFLQGSTIQNELTNIKATLQGVFYQNWLIALQLLKIEIAQFSKASPAGGPTLSVAGVSLIERERNEIIAGGGLSVLGGDKLGPGPGDPTKSDSTAPVGVLVDPITERDPSNGLKATTGTGLAINFYLAGKVYDFYGTVKFDDLETNRKLEPSLSQPLKYWQLALRTEASARIDAAAIFSLFAKLPPQVADALGSLLKNIGSIDAFIKIINRQEWMPLAKNTKHLTSSNPTINQKLKSIGAVSELSVLIANDIFKKICLYKGFSAAQCEPIVAWNNGKPVVDQIKKNIILPIYRCEATSARENLIPIYNQYVVAPTVNEEEYDFFAADPNQSPIILQAFSKVPSLNETWERENFGIFGGGRQGVFTEEVPLKECFLSEANHERRCLKIKYHANGYEGKCAEINNGKLRSSYGFSLINQPQIIYNPNYKR